MIAMKQSIFNRIIPYKNGKQIVVNTLSGAIDLLPQEYCTYLETNPVNVENEITAFLSGRRYLLEEDINEKEIFRMVAQRLLAEQRKNSPLKCVVIVTFDCNLKCSYCWQQHKLPTEKPETISEEKVDAIFHTIEQLPAYLPEKSTRPPLIQIFGGEPLLKKNYALVEYILKKGRDKHYEAQVTTNGVNLSYFEKMLLDYDVKEVQVTIDGTASLHNQRRRGSDYQSLMNSLERLLQHNALYVKLRVNTDLTNVDNLHDLANEIIDRGWYTSRKFYAYLAPLRDSSFARPGLITQRLALLEELQRLKKLYPQIEIFDLLGWDGYQPCKALQNNGRFPLPKAHLCDINLNQFVFAPDGKIHLCAEEAHGQADLVGEYYPQFKLDQLAFQKLYERSALELERCQNCTLLPICGGGCGWLCAYEQFYDYYCKTVAACFDYGLKEYIEGEEFKK